MQIFSKKLLKSEKSPSHNPNQNFQLSSLITLFLNRNLNPLPSPHQTPQVSNKA